MGRLVEVARFHFWDDLCTLNFVEKNASHLGNCHGVGGLATQPDPLSALLLLGYRFPVRPSPRPRPRPLARHSHSEENVGGNLGHST